MGPLAQKQQIFTPQILLYGAVIRRKFERSVKVSKDKREKKTFVHLEFLNGAMDVQLDEFLIDPQFSVFGTATIEAKFYSSERKWTGDDGVEKTFPDPKFFPVRLISFDVTK